MTQKIEFDAVYFIYIIMTFLVVKMFKDGYFKGFFKNFLNEFKYHKKFLLIMFVLAVFSIFFVDERVAVYFRDTEGQNKVLATIAMIGNTLGNGDFLFSILITFGMVFLLINKKDLEILFYMALGSSAMVGILNQVLKALVMRQRPGQNYDPSLIFAYGRAASEGRMIASVYDSMPSGHTISITGAAIVIAMYCKNRYLKAFMFILPLITVFGRIYLQKHWVSDVIIAYALGTVFAISFYKLNSFRLNKKP